MPSIFTKIINREIPSTIVYEDDTVIAFNDIHPLAPIHILIVPKKEIPTVNDVTAEDEPILGHLFSVARQIASDLNIAESGYRLIMNCNGDGGQEVFHLHLHLLGGEKIGPMRVKSS